MIEQFTIPTSAHLLRQSYREDYASKLQRIEDGSGRGREGLQDGWIVSGVSIYRPFTRTADGPLTDLSDALEAATLDVAIRLHEKLGHEVYLQQVIINRMEAGAKLDWHIDGAPYYHRYHIPLLTDGVMFYEGEQRIMMYEGFVYGPISYWLPHKVENSTLHERVHAILDFGPEI